MMSERSRHMPKNSELSKSPSVRPLRGSADETTRTIWAGPTGTSAGKVMRSSRSGGISALRFTVLTTVFSLGAARIRRSQTWRPAVREHPAGRHVVVHLVPVSQVESDGPVDLLQA